MITTSWSPSQLVRAAVAIAIAVLALSTGACNEANVAAASGTVTNVSAADALAQQAGPAADAVVVLDVRTPAEFEAGHLPGAINIDISSDSFANQASALDPDKTYLVHCAVNPSNGRADRAIQTLQGLGFADLQNLVGGYRGISALAASQTGND